MQEHNYIGSDFFKGLIIEIGMSIPCWTFIYFFIKNILLKQ